MTNSITEITRRNLFDDLRIAKVNWSGRLGEDEFLARVLDLTTLHSNDRRCANMGAEIWFHRHNFHDWSDDWVFDDSRLNLLRCPDDVLLNFLCQMIHPVVRQDADECAQLAHQFNVHLAADSFEIVPHRFKSKRPIYVGRALIGVDDVPGIARIVANELNSGHVAAQVNRMEAAVQNDPPLAIGTAKEFIETICKAILAKRGVARTGSEDITRLVRMTREALGIEDNDANGALRKIINGLATVTQGIAELRGKHGTGHGPDPDAKTAAPVVARLSVGAAVALGVFLLETHQRSAPEAADDPSLPVRVEEVIEF